MRNLTSEAKILIGIGLATAVILIVGLFFLSNNPETAPTASNTKINDVAKVIKPDSHKIGSDSAKLTIVEFSDFQCPACKVAEPGVEQFLKEYQDKIRFVYKHFPLPQHKNAEKAAQASEAADEQGKFWQYHNKLFASQADWSELSASEAQEKFIQYATELGLDTNKFKEGLESNKFDPKVKADLNDGLSLDVNSTPTFFFNNEKYQGSTDFQSFKQKIDSILK